MWACAWMQAVQGAALVPILTLLSDGAPMRFGVPLDSEVLADGLALRGRGDLQWRRLPVGAVDTEGDALHAVWIELAIVAPRGRVRVVRGGVGPSPDRRGAAYVHGNGERRLAFGTEAVQSWRWADGSIDERRRTRFTTRTILQGEVFEIGEGLTRDSPALWRRSHAWLAAGANPWRGAAGDHLQLLLPRGPAGAGAARRGLTSATRAVRRHLGRVAPRLVEMAGLRGAGDFVRSDGEVTNLEFDTTLGLLRCALTSRDESVYGTALRCAAHLRDRDLDLRSGLPFGHGKRHRGVLPQTGHTWLQGLLWVALLTADDEALQVARAIGRALAVQLPTGRGRNEKLRDYAWPLFEIESLLLIDPSARLAAAADRLALAIAARFDAELRTFRFGEGAVAPAVHLERAWLTAGLLLPALRLHLRRRPDRELARQVAVVEKAIRDRIGSGARGLPTHWRVVGGRATGTHYERGTARSAWLLDALSVRDRRRLLGKGRIARAMQEVPSLDHPDLPTEFSMLARCRWLW